MAGNGRGNDPRGKIEAFNNARFCTMFKAAVWRGGARSHQTNQIGRSTHYW